MQKQLLNISLILLIWLSLVSAGSSRLYGQKMDRIALKDAPIIERLNESYYALRMDIESKDTIFFGNTEFRNKNAKKRNAVHEIPLMMASRKGRPFSLPAMVLFNEEFVATARYFQYLDAQQMLGVL
ncbi:hypothetical protein ACV07N_10900 [Roseivirga echinicomitans]